MDPIGMRYWGRGTRRMLHLLGLVLILLTGACGQASGQKTAPVPDSRTEAQETAVAKARERIRAILEARHLPGVSVAVGLDGDVVWAEGFGWADLEQSVPMTPLTRLRVGSVSKPLTSVAVGRLLEQGRIDLDAPVQQYVPEFPEKRWPITTRELMAHTAGIRHYVGDEEPLSSVHYDDVFGGLKIFAADSLLFRPGTQQSYSTYGWNLVGAVVQRAAGVPFLEFMRQEVFAKAGMTHTVPDDVYLIVPDRARFYQRDAEGRPQNADFVDQSNKWGGGGFLSTPSDLVRFGYAMLEHELLDADTVTLLWTPIRLESGEETDNGLGWGIQQLAGKQMIGHGGSSIGGRASLMIFPEERLVLAVMSNVTGAEIPPIVLTLLDLFDPSEGPG